MKKRYEQPQMEQSTYVCAAVLANGQVNGSFGDNDLDYSDLNNE